jgi:hypothetical protein
MEEPSVKLLYRAIDSVDLTDRVPTVLSRGWHGLNIYTTKD